MTPTETRDEKFILGFLERPTIRAGVQGSFPWPDTSQWTRAVHEPDNTWLRFGADGLVMFRREGAVAEMHNSFDVPARGRFAVRAARCAIAHYFQTHPEVREIHSFWEPDRNEVALFAAAVLEGRGQIIGTHCVLKREETCP